MLESNLKQLHNEFQAKLFRGKMLQVNAMDLFLHMKFPDQRTY